MNGQQRSTTVLTVALQVLGALAGLATLTALVGGAMLWIRFDALRLPADHAVALLPERLLVTLGVHALVAPVLVALAVAVTIVLIDPLRRVDGKPRKRLWVVWAIVLAGGAVAISFGVEGLNLKYQLPMYAIGLFAITVLIISALASQTRGGHVALITFAAFVVCGAALAVLRTAGRPMMEPIAVLLTHGRGLSGFHVASTDGHIYVATVSGEGDPADPFADAPVDRILEIPRAEVVRRAVRQPSKVGTDGGGRDQAQSLLLDLRVRYTPSAAPLPPTSKDPVGDFAPLVNLHSDERYWPMGAGEFLGHSTLYWRHAGKCSPWRATDARHVPVLSQKPEKVDAKRLGVRALRLGLLAKPYEHTPSGARCRDEERPVVTATQSSRPFQEGRPTGLAKDEGFFLDASTAVRAGAGRRHKLAGQVVFDKVPLYFEQNPEGDLRKRITYWLFYGFSLPPGPEPLLRRFAHEGDWERLSVLVERVGARRWRPLSVRFHFHDEARDVPWSAVRLAADEEQAAAKAPVPTHPVAYVARNSHATYARAGRFEQRRSIGSGRIVSAFDEALACADCPQWRTWNRLRNAKVQYWYGFGGAWGVAGVDGSRTGPLGPSQRKSVPPSEPSLREATERRNIASDGS